MFGDYYDMAMPPLSAKAEATFVMQSLEKLAEGKPSRALVTLESQRPCVEKYMVSKRRETRTRSVEFLTLPDKAGLVLPRSMQSSVLAQQQSRCRPGETPAFFFPLCLPRSKLVQPADMSFQLATAIAYEAFLLTEQTRLDFEGTSYSPLIWVNEQECKAAKQVSSISMMMTTGKVFLGFESKSKARALLRTNDHKNWNRGLVEPSSPYSDLILPTETWMELHTKHMRFYDSAKEKDLYTKIGQVQNQWESLRREGPTANGDWNAHDMSMSQLKEEYHAIIEATATFQNSYMITSDHMDALNRESVVTQLVEREEGHERHPGNRQKRRKHEREAGDDGADGEMARMQDLVGHVSTTVQKLTRSVEGLKRENERIRQHTQDEIRRQIVAITLPSPSGVSSQFKKSTLAKQRYRANCKLRAQEEKLRELQKKDKEVHQEASEHRKNCEGLD